MNKPSFWSSYKAKVIELPSPTIEHIAPVSQRLVLEKTHYHREPVQELVVEEKIHTIEQPKIIEQIRVVEEAPPRLVEQVRVVEEGAKGAYTTKSHHHQNIVLQEHQHDHHHDLAHERRHEELNYQREQREQLKEIQHFQQIRQHEQIRQQLNQQKHLETDVGLQKTTIIEPVQIVQSKTNEHIDHIIQQKQERNERLTIEEEAIAEPFPFIPKTSFSCDAVPFKPGMYAGKLVI